MLKKEFKGAKKEALIATQSNDDSSNFDDDVCFMALDDELCFSSSNISYGGLGSMYSKLCKEMMKS